MLDEADDSSDVRGLFKQSRRKIFQQCECMRLCKFEKKGSETLHGSFTNLCIQDSDADIHIFVSLQIDPKALSKSELFGKLDATTREWSDGVFTALLRKILAGQRSDEGSASRHWIVLDGDVDPEWVENLNSMLDDNKLLTLPNGERLALPHNVRVIFEVEDLRYATLATVSRCGMVWFGAEVVQPHMVATRWLECRAAGMDSQCWSAPTSSLSSYADATIGREASLHAACLAAVRPMLSKDGLLEAGLAYATSKQHIMAFSQQQCTLSFVALLATGVARVCEYDSENPDNLNEGAVQRFMTKHSLLALVWALGGSMSAESRKDLHRWLQSAVSHGLPNNPENTLFDYEVRLSDGEWVSIQARVPIVEVEAHRIPAGDVLVTTAETLTHEELLRSLLRQRRFVLLCGMIPSHCKYGYGKYVRRNPVHEYTLHTQKHYSRIRNKACFSISVKQLQIKRCLGKESFPSSVGSIL
jgi:dynein heavy chain 1